MKKAKNKILYACACALMAVITGMSLFGLIYYNNHYCIAGWQHYLLIVLVGLSGSLLFAVMAIFKEIDENYFSYYYSAGLIVAFLVVGGALIIAGVVCTLLVSQLFWIMTGIGGLSVAIGIVLCCWDKIWTYFLAVAVGIASCAVVTCMTLFIYDGADNITWSGTRHYGNGWLYKQYYEESPEESQGEVGLFGYNDRTAKNVRLPSEIDGQTVSGVGICSFRNGSQLKSVAIPDTIKIMHADAFKYCTSLTSVHYDGSVGEWCSIEFENELANPLYYSGNLYAENERVIDLDISDGITKIGAFSFYNCKYVKTLTIPATVIEIGDSAFYGCSALTEINFGGTKAQWKEIAKGENWNYLTGFYTVNCIDGEVSK